MTTETDKAMQDNNIVPNAERIKLWTDALESGRYKQGKNALYGDGAYCCLGVACELYRLHSGDKMAKWSKDEIGNWQFEVFSPQLKAIEYQQTVMPDAAADWFGVHYNPRIVVDGRDDYCTSHNDGFEFSGTVQPKTFSEIAAGIKRLVQDAG